MIERFCAECGEVFGARWQKKFCSLKCQMDHRYTVFIDAWKKGEKDGGIGITCRTTSAHLKRYLRIKFNNKCSICNWGEVNPVTGKVPVEIDHIDGNAENNKESNLRLICPNCHSLSSNYKGLNKGKGRKWRMNKYIRNAIV